MIAHQPENYVCPFCEFIAGKETDYNQKQDTVYQNEFTTAFIAPKWWKNNVGHVLVVPNKHHENIYTISNERTLRNTAASHCQSPRRVNLVLPSRRFSLILHQKFDSRTDTPAIKQFPAN